MRGDDPRSLRGRGGFVELNGKLCVRCYEAIVRTQKAIDRAFDEAFDEALAEKKETK